MRIESQPLGRNLKLAVARVHMPLAIDQAGTAVMSSLCYVGWDTGLSSLKNRHSSLSFTVCEFITAKYITRRCSDFKGEIHCGIGVQNAESKLCMRICSEWTFLGH